jgi:hypothetical protein
MRRDEAQARADQLNREDPDRATHRWFPREDGSGGWTVARVAIGQLGRPTGTLQPSKPEPTPEVPGTMPGGVSPWIPGGG